MAVHKVSLEQAIEVVEKLGANAPRALTAIATRICLDVKVEAMKNSSNDLLRVRTGAFRRYQSTSLSQIRKESGSVSIGLPKGQKMAAIGRVLNSGETITPKNSKFLRVPLPPALTGNRVDRFAGISLRSVGGLFPWRSETTGKLFLVERTGKSTIEPWYLLVPKVTIPPKHWFDSAVVVVLNRVNVHVDFVMRKFLAAPSEAPS